MGALPRLRPPHPEPRNGAGQRRQGGRSVFEGVREVFAFPDRDGIGPVADGEGQGEDAGRIEAALRC